MKKKAVLLVILSLFCISIFSGCNTKKSEDLQSKNNVSESKKENKDGSPDHKLKEDEYQIVKKSNGETVLYVGKSKTKVEALLNFTLRIFSGDNVRDKVFIYKVLNDKQVDVFSEKVDAYIKSTYEIVLGNLNEDERKNFLDENIKYFDLCIKFFIDPINKTYMLWCSP